MRRRHNQRQRGPGGREHEKRLQSGEGGKRQNRRMKEIEGDETEGDGERQLLILRNSQTSQTQVRLAWAEATSFSFTDRLHRPAFTVHTDSLTDLLFCVFYMLRH